MLKLEESLIGMIHLPPLPGSPRFGGSMSAVLEAAERDAETLARAGVDALLVENFGDAPFPKGAAGPETIAALSVAAASVARAVDLPLGINVLRNDGIAALGIAVAVGAVFIRVNVLSWARLTDQGIIEGDAAALQRARKAYGATGVRILADVDVKHSAPLAAVSVEDESRDVVERALADAIIVSGSGTSARTDMGQVRAVLAAVDVPVLIGSGLTPERAAEVRDAGVGAIVGSTMMSEGRPGGPVDLERAKRMVDGWRGEQRS